MSFDYEYVYNALSVIFEDMNIVFLTEYFYSDIYNSFVFDSYN